MQTPQPSDQQLAVLQRLYGQAQKDLVGLLSGTDFQRGKAAVLIPQVRAIERRLGIASDRWVGGNVGPLYRAGAAWADNELLRIGLKTPLAGGIDAQWMKINERAVNTFASQLARDLAGANKSMADNCRRIIATTQQVLVSNPELSTVIAKGLISGGSIGKIARNVRDRLAEGGRELAESGALSDEQLKQIADFQDGYITPGRSDHPIRVTQYCTLVASYQLRQAVSEATKQRLQETGEELGDPMLLDLVTITGPFSGDFCDFYVGKIFSVSGQSGEYPPLSSIPSSGPPFHPNCTHNLAPFVAKLATAKELSTGRINEKFLGMDGRQAQKAYQGIDKMFAARKKYDGQRGGPAEPVGPE
ncbi:MAG: hypothetical protein ABFD92_02015 [Planctomycetaceae bacterium]|nr:hypothetical protein [Planctomycetaceae bacterium]